MSTSKKSNKEKEKDISEKLPHKLGACVMEQQNLRKILKNMKRTSCYWKIIKGIGESPGYDKIDTKVEDK